MKTLSTEQQVELQQLFDGLSAIPGNHLTLQEEAQIAYWKNELKPKRVRRVKNLSEEQNIT